MTEWLKTWTPDEVVNAKDKPLAFAQYVQQSLGVPWPTLSDQMILRRRIKEFFKATPDADYYTLCRTAQWARSRRRRPPRIWMVVDMVRDAWAAGALPELDPATREDRQLEEAIAKALRVEKREGWRRRLIGAQGLDARRAAYRAWQQDRGAGRG